MGGDLALLWHCLELGKRQFLRMLYEPADAQAIVGKAASQHCLIFGSIWQEVLVRPVMRGDVLLRELAGGIPSFGEPLKPADHKPASLLHEAGVLDGEGHGPEPSYDDHGHRYEEGRQAYPMGVLHTGKHVIGVLPEPGDEHKDAVNGDEEHEPACRGRLSPTGWDGWAGCLIARSPGRSTFWAFAGSCSSSPFTASLCSSPGSGRTPITCLPVWRAPIGSACRPFS